MYKIILVICYAFVCFKWGNWRNWKAYYPTILYVIIGDLGYNFIFFNYDLWKFERLINHTVSDLLIAFAIFPCSIILFLSFFPKKRWKQILYIISWSLLNSLLEFISFKLGYITYYNNWTIYWSVGFYITAFSLVITHYKNPFIAWMLSAAFLLMTMLIFNYPWGSMK